MSGGEAGSGQAAATDARTADQNLRHFEIVDCAVRSDDHFYLMASHVYPLDEDVDDADSGPRRRRIPSPTCAAQFALSSIFRSARDDRKWAFRTVRNIEFMTCAVAETPASQMIGVSLDGQVYALGSGVSELEDASKKHGSRAACTVIRSAMSHGFAHKQLQKGMERAGINQGDPISYADARDMSIAAVRVGNPHCTEACLRAQLDAFYKNCDKSPLSAHDGGNGSTGEPSAADAAATEENE